MPHIRAAEEAKKRLSNDAVTTVEEEFIAEKDGADARAISEALTAIGWWPHLCHWRDLEDPEHTLFLDYRPWDDSLAGIMECHYPDLVAAFRHG